MASRWRITCGASARVRATLSAFPVLCRKTRLPGASVQTPGALRAPSRSAATRVARTSRVTISAAASAMSRVSATTAATASPTWRTWPDASVGTGGRCGGSAVAGARDAPRSLIPAAIRSAAVRTVRTPGTARACDVSILSIRPAATSERTKTSTAAPVMRSPAKTAPPVSRAISSSRGSDCPIMTSLGRLPRTGKIAKMTGHLVNMHDVGIFVMQVKEVHLVDQFMPVIGALFHKGHVQPVRIGIDAACPDTARGAFAADDHALHAKHVEMRNQRGACKDARPLFLDNDIAGFGREIRPDLEIFRRFRRAVPSCRADAPRRVHGAEIGRAVKDRDAGAAGGGNQLLGRFDRRMGIFPAT